MADVHPPSIEGDGGNQSILVSANVEYDQIPHPVRGRKRSAQRAEIVEVIPSHDGEPPNECALAVRMRSPKVPKRFARDDVHAGKAYLNTRLFSRMGPPAYQPGPKTTWDSTRLRFRLGLRTKF